MRRTQLARPMLVSVLVATAVAVALAAVIGLTQSRRRARAAADALAAGAAERPPEAAPEWMRRFVRGRFNPLVERLGLVGGRRSPWAYLEHVGRRTGTVYRTPVLPISSGDHLYVPLPYGVDVNWARNVRTAGHCRLQRHQAVYELDEPAVITASEHPGVPAWSRARLERRGRRYLRLHILSTVPGTLATTSAAMPPVPSPRIDDAPAPAAAGSAG